MQMQMPTPTFASLGNMTTPTSAPPALGTILDTVGYGAALLRGELVRLRALDPADLPLLEAWWSDPSASLLQTSTVRPRPEGSAAALFSAWSENADPGSAGFSIESLADGELVGHLTLHGAALPERRATLSIMIGPRATGRGLGTDAVKAAVRYGFEQMGLNRIELRALAMNARALAAYAKAGFVREGTLREAAYFAGGFHDQVVMGILRREWEERGGAGQDGAGRE